MLRLLVESGPRRARSGAQVVFSITCHVALGVGAIEATRRPPGDPPSRIVDTIHIPLAPVDEPVRRVATGGPASPLSIPVVAPISVPVPTTPLDGIPPAEPGAAIDPSRFVLGPAPCSTDCSAPTPSTDQAFIEAAVDEPARVIHQPAPEYPPVLKAAGIEGRVVLEFVVDTLGAVERSSIRVVEPGQRGFEESAQRAVLGARFAPARIRGQPVRQLVRQGVGFRIQ
ncbi:MAG: TonB family protein [Gemmatimonadales bacterium]